MNLGFSENERAGIYHSIYDSFYWYSHFDDTDYTHGRALEPGDGDVAAAPGRCAAAAVRVPQLRANGGGVSRRDREAEGSFGAASRGRAQGIGPAEEDRRGLRVALSAVDGKSGGAALDHLAKANELLFRTERAMLLPAGLPGREWFKHQIYAPGLYTGYGAKTLPGIREAAEAGRWEEANRQADALAGTLRAVRDQIEQAEKALSQL